MEKLTLEQCNALPIEELFFATIQEEIDFERNDDAAQKVRQTVRQKIGEEVAKEKAKRQADISDEQEKDITELVTALALCTGTTAVRATVVWKCPDGRYISLNGYGNGFYDKSQLSYMEPLGNYYKEGTFRFVEELDGEKSDDGFMCGIMFDVDDLAAFDEYDRKVKASIGGSWF